MHKNFKAVSLSHKSASIAIRESVALNEETCKRLLKYLKEFTDFTDVLILSTCNRTEIYYSSEDDQSSDIIKLIGIHKGIDNISEYADSFVNITNQDEVVTRLYRVAIGLESQVIGDMQISNQVKKAYQWTADEDLASPFLHRLLHSIFFTNKKVVQETAFRDGAASVSFAATEMIVSFTNEIENPKILICGLGEIGEDVCKNLASFVKSGVYLTNRTFSKAEKLAAECGFDTIPFEEVHNSIGSFDIIVSSVNMVSPLITQDQLKNAAIFTHKFLIDLAVPRSITPDVEDLPGVLLYNIDDIKSRATEALKKRIDSIPSVEAIVLEAIADFNNWSKEMIVSPTIHKLKNALEEIRLEEISRHLKGLNPTEVEKIEKITKRMMQKVIKLPVLQLKAACKRGEAENLIDLLNDLFNLEKSTDTVKK
jgi:glutamyl-tRNA reductase